MLLNLEKQLEFYGQYHHTKGNKAIHMVCVPIILTSSFLLATNTPSLIPMPQWSIIPNLPPNLATISTLVYSALYILMEPVAGGILAPILLAATAFSKHLTSTYGADANYMATGVQIVCWIGQFVGHGVFERRAPALRDNLVQALFLAPFFVWMELLFSFGYRPELQSRVEAAVQRDLEQYRKSQSLKSNGVKKAGQSGKI